MPLCPNAEMPKPETKKSKRCSLEIGDHLHKQTRGWLLPYLFQLDIIESPPDWYKGHGRWAYWLDACERCQVPEEPIPQIHFETEPFPDDGLMMKEVLEYPVRKGTRWYDEAFLDLVKWLLHGFGRRDMEEHVERIPPDVRNFWYEKFDLGKMLRSPMDWSAYILQGGPRWMKVRHAMWSQSTGFFSTPMNVCQMMTDMLFVGTDPEQAKIQTVCDPCCGTGSMLLPASNHSLRLFGQDIVPDLCYCAELNGWLWMPWIVYTPPEMKTLFDYLDNKRSPKSGVRLDTNPDHVEATQAYRSGELTQGEFFKALGV
jgi:hypothetical protein